MRVLVVDDEEVVAAGVARLLESAGYDVTYCQDLVRARQLLDEGPPVDLVLLDLHLGAQSSLGSLGELTGGDQPPRVLLLTGDQDPGVVAAALRAGAAGVLRKTSNPEELLRAVAVAAGGGAVLSSDDLGAVLAGPISRGPLSVREHEVLRFIDEGMSTSGIASRLVLSEHTVRGHVQNVLRKLGADSRLAALAIARRRGLLGDSDGR